MTKEYVSQFYPLAKKAADRYGIDPAVILAQASLESNWGTSYAARNRRNHFGITAGGLPNKYWDGSKSQSESSKLWFRIYKSDQDSFYDFARLIHDNYPDSAKVSSNIAAYAHSIAQSAYISEKNGDNRQGYESTIRVRGAAIKEQINSMNAEKKKKLYFKISIIVLSLAIAMLATYLIIKSKTPKNVQ